MIPPLTSARLAVFATLATLATLAAAPAFAKVAPNSLFSYGAVLQRDTPIPIWGTSTREGEKVTVTLGDKSAATVAKGGQWRVDLPARASGGEALTLTIAGDNTVTIRGILMGEVWICSGQSNMEMPLAASWPKHIDRWEEEIAAAKYQRLRLFTVKRKASGTPVTEVSGQWETCAPETVKNFSAVANFFGRDLQKALGGVPLGLISTNWGGTTAEAWTSRPALEALPELKQALAANDHAVSDYHKKLAGFKNDKVSLLRDYEAAAAKAKSERKPAPAKPVPPADPSGRQSSPATLRNGMITPLIPYAMRGVIWYQGESNDARAKDYQKLFPAMIADWRKDWGRGDFPFLFVQIAPCNRMSPEIREAQLLTLGRSANTAMAVTTDVGDAECIHPPRKEPVGARLALAARALAYGEKLEYSGPLFAGAKFTDGKATVSFSHTGAGLLKKEGGLRGFTLAGSDKKFHPAHAEISGDQITVSSEQVPSPRAVRYGWSNVPEVNLFNSEGLPASPFRSDAE